MGEEHDDRDIRQEEVHSPTAAQFNISKVGARSDVEETDGDQSRDSVDEKEIQQALFERFWRNKVNENWSPSPSSGSDNCTLLFASSSHLNDERIRNSMVKLFVNGE